MLKQYTTEGSLHNKALAIALAGADDKAKLFDQLEVNERQEVGSILDSLTQSAASASTYLGHRYNNGCGDSGHENALTKAAKALKRLRKHLGYSYP